jgi:hypothetical protein
LCYVTKFLLDISLFLFRAETPDGGILIGVALAGGRILGGLIDTNAQQRVISDGLYDLAQSRFVYRSPGQQRQVATRRDYFLCRNQSPGSVLTPARMNTSLTGTCIGNRRSYKFKDH